MLKKGLYILNYHDINWESSQLVRGIGSTISPDRFEDHLKILNQNFKFLSLDSALQRLRNNKIDEPTLSIWFDDGLIGIRRYAYEILEKYEVKAATSVNSDFFLKKDMFWRFKLSAISFTDGLKLLRLRLRKFGYSLDQNLKDFTLDKFSGDILDVINITYNEFYPKYFREDAFRVFDNVEGLRFLQNNGWTLANHTCSHYPIAENSALKLMEHEFLKCEKIIEKYFNFISPYWVIPFDRVENRSRSLLQEFERINDGSKFLVMLGNKVNYEGNSNIINRIGVSQNQSGLELLSYLKKL